MAVARIDALKDPEVVRRRERERVMVEEGIQLWRRQKEEQWQQKRREQHELKDMLAKYYPWGRPGCGAPNPDGVRKRKLELEGLYPEDYRLSMPTIVRDKMPYNVQLGKPGHGAPRRTASGHHVTTAVVEDPQLQFQTDASGRRSVNNVLRYRQEPWEKFAYRQQLDAMVNERRKIEAQERVYDAERNRSLMAMSAPWGRPGPGGLTWREPTTVGHNFLHSLGWSDETTLRTLDTRQRDPGPQPTESCADLVALLARKRPPSTTRFPLPSTDVTEITKIKDGPGLWGSPEVLYSRELEQQVHTKRMIMQQERREDLERSQQHFETWQRYWGRPGHGAPKEVKVKGNLDMMLRHVPVK